jgi:hypothetical protein
MSQTPFDTSSPLQLFALDLKDLSLFHKYHEDGIKNTTFT